MRVITTLRGTKPLLMHNIQLANPDNVWAKRISEITKRRKKTEEDRIDLARLEWLGSLYTDGGRIVMPTTNVLKCFKETAKISKEGRTLTRALVPVEIALPLVYKGPSNFEELSKLEEYRDQTLVNVRGQRVVRTRPIFREWACEAEWELLTDVLSFDDFVSIAKRAGRVEGLGDNRVNGYGRFETEIAEIAEMEEAA